MAVLDEYLWLVIVGAIGAFGFGWGTGSNDVANAFGTSVGSKTLTLKQAVILAAIFEFAGALLLGRVSTNTIAGGIADVTAFASDPEVYAYGMMIALLVGTVFQATASKFGLNVSATHTIIGGILGFALVWAGTDGVIWATRDPGAFPPYKGVVAIFMSWFVAPILSGAAAAVIFFLIRFLVLRRKNAYTLAFWTLPPFVAVTVFINMYFVFTKGAKKALSSNDDWTDAKACWVSAVIAAGVTFLTIAVLLPILRKMANSQFDSEGKAVAPKAKELQTEVLDPEAPGVDGNGKLGDTVPTTTPIKKGFGGKMWAAVTHGVNVDIHRVVEKDQTVGDIHANAEVFEPRVEYAFKYLQVFSAICVIFAHGAGEVGYMAGPLATIWDVYRNGMLTKSVSPPVWIVLIGAIGLVVGLATYGYNVTRTMGVKLAKLTPTRGFAAELATAFVIMIAAQYGLPTSSSACITGAIVGVGMLEGRGGVNWKLFAKQFASWIATVFVVGGVVALIFAGGVYAPSAIDASARLDYEKGISNFTGSVYRDYNSTLNSYRTAAAAGALTNLPAAEWTTINRTVGANAKVAKDFQDPKKTATVTPQNVLKQLNQVAALIQENTIWTVGQSGVYAGQLVCSGNTTATARTGAACRAPSILRGSNVQSFVPSN